MQENSIFKTLGSTYYNVIRGNKVGWISGTYLVSLHPSSCEVPALLPCPSISPGIGAGGQCWYRCFFISNCQLESWVCVVRSSWESWWIRTWSSNKINSVWAAWSSCRNNFHHFFCFSEEKLEAFGAWRRDQLQRKWEFSAVHMCF